MKTIPKKVILMSIVLSTTQVFSIPIIGLSPYQIILFVTLFVCIMGLFRNQRGIPKKNFSFVVIWLTSSILSFMLSTNISWAKSYLLFALMTMMYLLFIPYYFDRSDINILLKSFIRSQYITIFFSVYFMVSYYVIGVFPKSISVLGLSINLDNDFMLRSLAGIRLRLSLPYATPPVLSMVMAMVIIILLLKNDIYSIKWRIFLILSFSMILLFTASRTGIVAIIFCIFYLLLRGVKRKRVNTKKFLLATVGLIVASIVGIYLISKVSYFTKFVNGFKNIDLSTDRHFLIPLDGLLIWLDSIKNFIIGIGFGSSINIVGRHTDLPAHLMNSFVTLIVERGLMGVYIVVTIVKNSIALLKNTNNYELDNDKFVLGMILLVGLVSSIFYEVLDCYLFVVAISISFIFTGRGNNEEYKFDNTYI